MNAKKYNFLIQFKYFIYTRMCVCVFIYICIRITRKKRVIIYKININLYCVENNLLIYTHTLMNALCICEYLILYLISVYFK